MNNNNKHVRRKHEEGTSETWQQNERCIRSTVGNLTVAEIINGNQGPNWQPFETNVDLSAVPANDIVEVSDLSQVASLLFEHGCIDHD